MLHLPDHDKPYTLPVDASEVGVGAVLLQVHDGKLFPVGYGSKKLTGAERKYSAIERECLAVVWAVKKYLRYLYGREFTIQTDHQPLQYLSKAKFINDRVMRCSLELPDQRARSSRTLVWTKSILK